jgi:hypothetical protein
VFVVSQDMDGIVFFARFLLTLRCSFLSHFSFVFQFCKTTLYEMLPIPLATLCCTCLDGWQQARNRFGLFFCCIFLPIFDMGWSAVVAVSCFVCFRDNLSRTAGYELLEFVLLPMLGRAVTLAIKYALYSDTLLSVDNDLSLYAKGYERKGLMRQYQMTSYILNVDGNQRESLVRFLYTSMLYADTDLSQCHLVYNLPSPPSRPTSLSHFDDTDAASDDAASDDMTAISAFSRSLLQMLRGLADFNKVIAEIDTDSSGDFSLEELRQCAQLTSMSDTEVRQCFKHIDANQDGVVSKKEFEDSSLEVAGELTKLTCGIFLEGIPQCILKPRRGDALNRRLSDKLREGEIPCSLAALHIIIGCSAVPAPPSRVLVWPMLCMLLALTYVFLGGIIRSMQGKDAYGSTWQEQLFYIARIIPEFLCGFQLQFFACGPCIWYSRQMIMAQRLLDLIDPPRVADCRWHAVPTSPNEPQAHLPKLNLTIPSNVEGWSSMRRVIFGRNFAPAVEFKFQCYVSAIVALFLVSSLAQALGSYSFAVADTSQDTSQEDKPLDDLDFIMVGILRPLGLSIPIIMQIMLAYKLNRFGFLFTEALQCQSLKCAALAASLCPFGEDEEGLSCAGSEVYRESVRLDRAASMLAAAAAEIEAEMESRPMRVIFMKADPGATSMMISIILTVIALQIYGVAAITSFVS